jgi:uncharacterized Tic20 family protein
MCVLDLSVGPVPRGKVEFSAPTKVCSSFNTPPNEAIMTDERDRQARQWAMFLHLSLLAGYIVPGAGFVAPIVIWQLKKADYPELDEHGKMVANWLISALIYGAISFLLVFVVVGVPLLIVLGILLVVFPIVGAVKANNGELWRYPLTVTILK